MLKTDTPRNRPNRPPQIAIKSVVVIVGDLCRVTTYGSRNEMLKIECCILKLQKKKIRFTLLSWLKSFETHLDSQMASECTYFSVLLNGILSEVTIVSQSNVVRSISASYIIAVQDGKQLHFSRNDRALLSLRPSITS